MNKKVLVGTIALLVVVGVGIYAGTAKPTSHKVYRVGVLNALEYFSPIVDGFKQKMTELGYVEGENIIYDVEKGPAPVGNQAIVKKFVDEKVDLILVFPTEASLEAKEGTRGTAIPVIAVAVATEGNNLVASVQNPGGNLTGVRFPIPEVAAKRLEILHELVPGATRMLVPYLRDYPTVAPALAAIEPIAKALHITLLEVPFSTPDEVAAYLTLHERNVGLDAILMIPEPLSITAAFSDQIYAFADARKLPVVSASILDTDHGAVFGLAPSSFEMGTLAAPLADRILSGIPPGTIPIVTPGSILEINYKAIQKLGLTASEGLLSTADRISH